MNFQVTKLVPKITALVVLLGIIIFAAVCGPGSSPPEDAAAPLKSSVILLSNARIYAFDEANSIFESGTMAVSETGEIVGIGESEAMAAQFPGIEPIDLGGKTVLPGLIDSHAHLYGLALAYTQANLMGADSKAEVMARLREFEADMPEGDWLLGRGWDQNDWPEQVFPNRADLDAEFPDRPVWLRRVDGHAAWGNSLALAQADQDLAGEWQPQGGHIQRDAQGEASGIFIDKAMALVDRAVPATSPELISTGLDMATRAMVSLGLTAVHDAGINRQVLALYQQKIESGAFPVRVYAMADGMNETLNWLCENGPFHHPSGKLIMRSVKLYADGALGSRGAALLADYSDDPGNSGLLFVDQDTADANVWRVMSCGLQVAVHAIGDAANRQLLDAYEKALTEFPDNPGRHRMEHAQILDPADVPRFAGMDIIAAMQPTHATSDMYWAGERLGTERLAGAYAWSSLLRSGAKLAFGSDFPVEEVNPMHGIYAAVTRQDLEGSPEGGWLPQERLDREQAIRAFTLDAAYAGFLEQETGSLEQGKRADFIVLNRDIMAVATDEIPEIQVEQTWVDGKLVFRR